MKYKYVWFDLGLTLVRAPVEKVFQQVLQHYGVQKQEHDIRRAFHLTDKVFMRDYPHVLGTTPSHFMPWYLGVLHYHLGIALDIMDVYQRYIQYKQQGFPGWQAIDGARETLQTLHDKGVHTGLISNWDHTCRSVLERNGLASLMDMIIVSSEVGIEKPDKSIFQMALDTAGIDAGQALYVGDNYYDDVIGAQKVGMTCVLINPYGSLGMEEVEHPHIISDIREVVNYFE